MFHEKLENGFVMRTLLNESDRTAFAAFNARYNNVSEGATCQCLLRHHPSMDNDSFFIVEDERDNGILACLCLIPWVLRFEGVALNAAMMEMVLSHPACRRMGLVKKLIRRFQEEVGARGFDLTLITGIPNYYRQFGYSYALDLGEGIALATGMMPEIDKMLDAEKRQDADDMSGGADISETADGSSCLPHILLRTASASDIAVLQALHNHSIGGLQLYLDRDEAYWRYLLDGARFDIRLIEDVKTGEVPGYVMLKREGGFLCIMESGIRGDAEAGIRGLMEKGIRSDTESGIRSDMETGTRVRDVSTALLRCLAGEAGEGIRIYAHAHDGLLQAAASLGGMPNAGDQWLLKVEDPVILLTKLVPVFEKRISESPMSGLSAEVIINQFRQAFSMRIAGGKITDIRSIGFVDSSMGSDGGDLCIPADAFLRLLFGYRTLEQLWDAWPDTVVKDGSRDLLRILFPVMDAHLLAPYHYQGEINPDFLSAMPHRGEINPDVLPAAQDRKA